MVSDKVNNRKFFDNDDDFYGYVVVPEIVVRQVGDQYYNDFNFSPDYLNDVNNGCKFVIKDENSQIFKHKAVSYRTITKKINNLCPYYAGFEDIVFDCEC